MIQNTNIIPLAAIAAMTILGLAFVITSSGGRFAFGWNQDDGNFMTIESRQTPEKANDCLTSGESSHYLNCSNR